MDRLKQLWRLNSPCSSWSFFISAWKWPFSLDTLDSSDKGIRLHGWPTAGIWEELAPSDGYCKCKEFRKWSTVRLISALLIASLRSFLPALDIADSNCLARISSSHIMTNVSFVCSDRLWRSSACRNLNKIKTKAFNIYLEDFLKVLMRVSSHKG